MALPTSPNTTYVASSTPAIKAQDLNDLQTYLAALYVGSRSLLAASIDGTGGQSVTPSAAQLLIKQSALADTPLAIFKDQGGNARYLIDHNGYPMGRDTILQENWIYSIGTVSTGAPTVISNAQGWSSYLSGGGGGTITITNPSTTYPAPMMTLNIPNAAQVAAVSSAIPVVAAASFVSAILEWEMGLSFLPAGSSMAVGFDGSNTASGGSAITIGYSSGASPSTSWVVNTHSGGSGTSLTSGVAISTSATPNTRCRIELHGSASPYGALTARFFVNETLVAITTNVPTAALYISISYNAGTPGGTGTVTVGPMRLVVNRMLALPSL